jgi:hypothetical protein
MHRRSTLTILACLALAAVLTTNGCASDLPAQSALRKGNEALVVYSTAEDAIARKIAEAAVVQPTPDGVKPGLALLAEVDTAMGARHKAALTAKAQFEAFKAAAADTKQKGYADHAIALADGLLKLDAGTVTLAKNMMALYQSVAKNSSNTERVVALADAVTKGQVAYDRLRAEVKTLSDAADQYFQQNLAGRK